VSLEVKDLVSGYGPIEILHGLSFKAEESKLTTIIGPNGCGKTTLLKSIYGFLKPKQGTILLNGENIVGLKPYQILNKGIAYVLQRRSVFPLLTVEENLQIGAWFKRKDQEYVKKNLKKVYSMFPLLGDKRKVKAELLSGGMQRMLEVGRAFMLEPKMILLDEPSAGLAPIIVKEIYEEIKKLKHEGVTTILVDQNVRLATNISDHVYVLDLGKIRFKGEKKDFENQMGDTISSWF